MNLIKLYGKLKEHYGNKYYYTFNYCEINKKYFNQEELETYTDFDLYILKLERLIQIVEYKLGILTQDEMDSSLFNEEKEKNDWVLHTFTHNYKKDDGCYHYYRKCYKCGYKWYCLHSRGEQEKRSCGCK